METELGTLCGYLGGSSRIRGIPEGRELVQKTSNKLNEDQNATITCPYGGSSVYFGMSAPKHTGEIWVRCSGCQTSPASTRQKFKGFDIKITT